MQYFAVAAHVVIPDPVTYGFGHAVQEIQDNVP